MQCWISGMQLEFLNVIETNGWVIVKNKSSLMKAWPLALRSKDSCFSLAEANEGARVTNCNRYCPGFSAKARNPSFPANWNSWSTWREPLGLSLRQSDVMRPQTIIQRWNKCLLFNWTRQIIAARDPWVVQIISPPCSTPISSHQHSV